MERLSKQKGRSMGKWTATFGTGICPECGVQFVKRQSRSKYCEKYECYQKGNYKLAKARKVKNKTMNTSTYTYADLQQEAKRLAIKIVKKHVDWEIKANNIQERTREWYLLTHLEHSVEQENFNRDFGGEVDD